MRGEFDCLTCVTAMLLAIKYEEVEQAFSGNLDPARGQEKESLRLGRASSTLLENYHHGVIHLTAMTPIVEGRRYWIGVRIDDASNPSPRR